jgi:hypothetical protein
MFEFKDDEPPDIMMEVRKFKEILINIESMNLDVIRSLTKEIADLKTRMTALEIFSKLNKYE